MASPLQILHLEDDPNDVELIHETLRAEKVDCTIEVVSSREGFVEALGRARLDLILSDYSVPGFDGLGALALAKERAEGVPFILVSGTLGEEAAIESMKSGATDYVLKTRLTRLAPAVRRALGEAAEARKRSRAERMFRSLLEAAPDAMVITDRGGRIVLVNVQAERMFGHSRNDLLGQKFDILLPPRSVGAHAALREHHFKKPAAHSAGPAVELPARHKSGREFPVEISLSPL